MEEYSMDNRVIKVIKYIHDNKIDVGRISKDTNISISKLKGESKEHLMADEFLELCKYLNIKPEDLK